MFYHKTHDKTSLGRHAESPTEIPSTGWKDTLLRVKKEMVHDRLTMVSAAMAYYALFAFVPAVTSIVLLYAWVSDPSDIVKHINAAARFIPAEAQDFLKSTLGTLTQKANSTLGLSAISGLLIALWSASKGSASLIDALNIIYEEEDNRSFIKRSLMAIGFTLVAAVMGVLAIGVIVVVPAITNLIKLPESMAMMGTIGSWIILLGLFSTYLSFVYRYAPARRNAKWKWVTSGAVIAVVLWAIVSAGFSFYAKEFGNFNKTYGSLGAVIVLMTWFYLSSFVVLLGAEINAELEHQTKKDTTTEPEKPMGLRGAKMADTIGPTADQLKASGGKTSGAQDHHRSLWH